LEVVSNEGKNAHDEDPRGVTRSLDAIEEAPSSKDYTGSRGLPDAERVSETDPGGDRTDIDKEDENPTEETAAHAGPPSQGSLKDEHQLDEETNTPNDERHETGWDAQDASPDIVAQDDDAVIDREPEGNDDGKTDGLVDQYVDEPFDAGQEPPPDPSISRLKKFKDAQTPIPDPAAERLLKSKNKGGKAKKAELKAATTESMYVESLYRLLDLIFDKITAGNRPKPLEQQMFKLKNPLCHDNVSTSEKGHNARLRVRNKRPNRPERQINPRQSFHVPLITREAACRRLMRTGQWNRHSCRLKVGIGERQDRLREKK
jgi:hypothetical protein